MPSCAGHANHLECGVDDFQLFGNILAQWLELAAAGRTGLLFRLQHPIFAWHVLGQGLAYRFLALPSWQTLARPAVPALRLPRPVDLPGVPPVLDLAVQLLGLRPNCMRLSLAICSFSCSISSERTLSACSSVDTVLRDCCTSLSRCASSALSASMSSGREGGQDGMRGVYAQARTFTTPIKAARSVAAVSS